MKKLMFATALVASAAAFADAPTAINATSFEGYSAGAIISNTGDVEESGADGKYFCFTGGDADGSLVKTFGGENLTAPNIIRPYYYASATPNDNYLELSTEGGTLWRSINTIGGTSGAYTLGTAEPVAADGTYLDTLVQFTPTGDGGAPTLESDDKLAIWLNVDSSGATPVTNLMVQAGWVDAIGTPVASNFVLTGTSVVAGEWYRLTIKAVPDIIDPQGTYAGFYRIPAFIILINGAEMAATVAPVDASLANLAGTISSDFTALVAANKVFPSIVPPAQNADFALQGVGFKGSGALDDLVWTTEDPLQGSSGGDDYKVTINGSDVVVTPSAEDLAAVQAAVIAGGGTLDVTDVAAVNAALAAEIGSTGVPSWQALFLGLPPTEAGLESFKIDSISFDEDGNVVVELPDDVDPKTGRGVTITLKLMGSNDLSSWTQIETAGGTDNKTFAPVQPGLGETKKFYKVVVEFAATPVD